MRVLKLVFFGLGILVSVAYLLNLGAGIFEIIPDNLPFVGNLDEAAFTAFLLFCLRGIHRTWVTKALPPASAPPAGASQASG